MSFFDGANLSFPSLCSLTASFFGFLRIKASLVFMGWHRADFACANEEDIRMYTRRCGLQLIFHSLSSKCKESPFFVCHSLFVPYFSHLPSDPIMCVICVTWRPVMTCGDLR